MSFYNNKPPSRRDRILHTALKLFCRNGYFNTSVHDIRKLAGVSIGLIYRYFANKEKIAQTIYSELLQETVDRLEQIIAEHPTTHDRCRAIMAFYFEATEAFPEMVDFIFFARHMEILPNGQPICAAKPPQLVAAMLAEGMENGDILTMDPEVATASIFGGCFRLIQLRLLGVIQEPLPHLFEQVWANAWRSVAAG